MKNIKPQYFAAPVINYDAAANKVNIGPYVKFDRRWNYDWIIADVKQRYLDHDPTWTTGYVIFETYNLKQKFEDLDAYNHMIDLQIRGVKLTHEQYIKTKVENH